MNEKTSPEKLRPLISCVAENSAPWFDKTFNLVLSVRTMGGSLADCPVVVNFVEGCENRFRERLEELGAAVRVVEPWGARFRFSNKLRMLELDRHFEFDVLVALDCDMLVIGDIRPHIDPAAISISPADRDPFTLEQWALVFDELGVKPPPATCVMRVTGQKTYPYYKTGVIFVPTKFFGTLTERWQHYLTAYDALQDRFPGAHHENQVAFALAAIEARLPIRELPPSLNLPTSTDLHPSFASDLEPPLIIHYHRKINAEGFILACPVKQINRYIHEFNVRRAAKIGTPYGKLPRAPLTMRLQRIASLRSWYSNRWLKVLRRSRLARVARKRMIKGEGFWR